MQLFQDGVKCEELSTVLFPFCILHFAFCILHFAFCIFKTVRGEIPRAVISRRCEVRGAIGSFISILHLADISLGATTAMNQNSLQHSGAFYAKEINRQFVSNCKVVSGDE